MMRSRTPAPEATCSAAGTGQPDPAAQDALPGLAGVMQSLLREGWTLARDHILLVVLEAQRAGRTVTKMIFAGVIAAVLLVTAWLALVACVVFWVVEGNTPWAPALLAVGLIHVAVSVTVIAWIRRVARDRIFASLVRQLHSGDRPREDAS